MNFLYLGLATEKNDSAPFLIENLIVLPPLLEVIMLTQEYLRNQIIYCPISGLFVERLGRPHTPKGKVLGYKNFDGYLGFKIKGKKYLSHRLAWFYEYGVWPNQIDHINRIKTDNRISNLRDCTKAENCCNRPIQTNNISGHKGIYYRKDIGKWAASIQKDRVRKHLGVFSKKEDAKKAYIEEAKKLHKEFSIYHKEEKIGGRA